MHYYPKLLGNEAEMAHEDVHYEVFLKKNVKASWTLVEALKDRNAAMGLAKKLQTNHSSGSIRVVREVWDAESGGFRGGSIFEVGPEKYAGDEKPAEASIPCLTPDDLSGPAARDTLRRALSDWLERSQVCPMELLHRPDLIEQLDGSDTDLQHAIQKVAIARAQNSDASVHAYVRLITELVQRGIEQSRKEAKAGGKPPRGKSFAETASLVAGKSAPEKLMRRAIADQLSESYDMGEKVRHLLDMHDDLPEDAQARALAATHTDAFMAEILSFDSALRRVLGDTVDLGDEVLRLTGIYEGAPDSPDLSRAPETARRLASQIKQASLPAAHNELAQQILEKLRAPKRFRPRSVMAEIELARKLAQRLIVSAGQNLNLNPDALVEAFTHRSARLLQPDAIEEALSGAHTPVDQIERLFAMEDHLVGEENKKKLASYIRGKVQANTTVNFFLRGAGQPLERLSQVTSLQARAMKGGFPKADKRELVEAFDTLGLAILDATKVMDRVAGSNAPVLDRAAALLKLAATGLLPEGRCRYDAQARAVRMMESDEGRVAAASPGGEQKMLAVQQLLAQLAPPETQSTPEEGTAA